MKQMVPAQKPASAPSNTSAKLCHAQNGGHIATENTSHEQALHQPFGDAASRHRKEVSSNLLLRKLMQIKGRTLRSATQEQTALARGLKAMQRRPGGQHSPVCMSRRAQDEAAGPGTMGTDGEWRDDARARRLHYELFLDRSGNGCGLDLPADSIVAHACSGAWVDDLIYLSAEMRGLIFRAYARRITDLLISGGRLGEGHTRDRRLN